MNIARFAAAAAALVALPLSAHATDVTRLDVVDKGIYEIVAGAETAKADAPTGKVTAVDEEKLVQATDSVAGKVGLEFGFRYKVVGDPDGEVVPLDFVVTYPPPGIKGPGDAEAMPVTRFTRDKMIGETAYTGYGFENDWEVVPGTWTFAIWYAGKKLAEETFTVTK
jgi:hypothetical protein